MVGLGVDWWYRVLFNTINDGTLGELHDQSKDRSGRLPGFFPICCDRIMLNWSYLFLFAFYPALDTLDVSNHIPERQAAFHASKQVIVGIRYRIVTVNRSYISLYPIPNIIANLLDYSVETLKLTSSSPPLPPPQHPFPNPS